jgi:hypothetical protein
MRRASL